jgi:Divergent InlB B-repeat domain
MVLVLCALAVVGAILTSGSHALVGTGTSREQGPDVQQARRASALIGPNLAAGATATWCGAPSEVDTKPNSVAGHPVHWIYVLPSDGQDRFPTFASVMQTDAETIESWWRSQDPSRAPRGDVAQFSCGTQLDLSVVRMSESSIQLSARETPFDEIWDTLTARGFSSEDARYVVYFDGPIGSDDICGAGGAFNRGPGMAMVFVRSCAGVASAEVAAHELLHAMGAVPDGAPHMCSPPDDAHTCDNTRDLMYPFSDGTPLSGLQLDPGRDDYYGHSGAWQDLQDSPWLIQLDRQSELRLTVTGPGRVEADVPGLDCAASCLTTWNTGTQLVLTPTPTPGAKLVRWSGPCSGAGQCAVTVGQGAPPSALFAPATYRVSVRVSGRGKIVSSNRAVACPGRCSSAVASYNPLRLTASAGKGWKLKSWTGACRGKRPTCTVPMTANASARAVFVRR